MDLGGDMEHVFFKGAITVGGALAGWILKVVWDAIKDLRAEVREKESKMYGEIKNLNDKVVETFLRKDDFKDIITELRRENTDIRSEHNRRFDRLDTMLENLEVKLDKRTLNE